MKRKYSLLFIALTAMLSSVAQIKYPETKKVTQVDDYFGTKVSDPYRWLEDDKSDETAAWVAAENKVTQDYLSKIPFREEVRKKLEEMWNYPKYSSPRKVGEYYYYYKNDGLQNQSVMYRQKGLNGTPEVFLDPNKMSKDGTAAVGSPSFSKTKKYAAYTIAQAGSDWQEGYVMDVATKKQLTDKIQWIKFSGLTWKGDDGFYYSRYPETDDKSKLSKQNQFHTAYYHKLGTPQSSDIIIYEDKTHPLRNVGIDLTEDERFLMLYLSEGTSGTEIWVKDLKNNQKDFSLLIKGFETEAGVVDNDGDRLLVQTNDGTPNYKVVSIDPKKPLKENWQTIIPTRTKLLSGVGTAGGKLFLNYLEDASTRVYQTNYKGILEREIKLPGIGSAGGFGGYKEDKEIFFTYSSFNYPPAIFRYDIASVNQSSFAGMRQKLMPIIIKQYNRFLQVKTVQRFPCLSLIKRG